MTAFLADTGSLVDTSSVATTWSPDTWSGPPRQQLHTRYWLRGLADLEDWGMDTAPADDALYAMGVAFEREDPDRLYYAITDFSFTPNAYG